MYGISPNSENCNPTAVVLSREGCEDAATKLGLTFKSPTNNAKRHAGCYKDYNDGLVYFNIITNPAETIPVLGSQGRRAICIIDGKIVTMKCQLIM